MGGPGSGRWGWFYRKKTTVEECCSLDVRWLRRAGLLVHGWPQQAWWADPAEGEGQRVEITALADAVELSYVVQPLLGQLRRVRYRVPLTWTSRPSGARQPWFKCPSRDCGRRVAKLYLPLRGRARYYLCRHCHDLSYHSRQTWDKRVAALRRDPGALADLLQGAGEGPVPVGRLLLAAKAAMPW